MKIPITEIHLYYKKRGINRRYRRKIKVPRYADNTKGLQRLIGRQLILIRDAAEYYYAVGVVTLDDGSEGFRTLIGKHFLGDE